MNALVIMSRIPVPYKTKTRLMNFFSGEDCAKLHKCFLKDIFNVCDSLKKNMDIYLTFTPEDDFSIIENLIPKYVKCYPQEGENLGKRMENAIEVLLKRGYEKVILIGSDIPELQKEYILSSIQILNSADIVIGPTLDGGYYLVGMKELHKEIFESNIKWGEKSVLEGTFSVISEKKLMIGFTGVCRDIDTKEDVKNLIKDYKTGKMERSSYPSNTLEFLFNYGSEALVKEYVI